MRIGILSWAAFFIWAASEVAIAIRTKLLRHNVSTKKLIDKGSYWLILIGLYIGIGICFLFNSQKWGWVSQSIANFGAVLMLISIVLRLWSIKTLGRSFSPIVSVDLNQMLVKSGPYKFIRHPAYTGTLFTFVFWGIAFNSWIASCIILFMLSAIFIYRIYVEEKALISHFHSDYEDYSHNTWRLIPFLW